VAWLFSVAIRCWLGTMRYRLASLDDKPHPVDPAQQRCIYAFWHETLLAPLRLRVKLQMLIGQHTDGEFIARVAQHCGFGVIRGSSSRGGTTALRHMICHSDPGAHLGVTPDGPRGPRRRVQVGMIAVASATGVPIVPFAMAFTRAWRLRSWDRFAVPLPFSTMCGVFGKPLHIPSNLDRHGLEAWRMSVEQEFLAVTDLAEDWAERTNSLGQRALPPDNHSPAIAHAAA
jgi:lysophospholipid acyltransferase (LPLAT)-like uncharacterized protein